MNLKRTIVIPLAAVLLLGCAGMAACHRLSEKARNMTGHYYITEISEDEPLLELNADATCTVRAIKPGVLTYAVNGTWNVEDDSLIVWVEPTIVEMRGDSTLIGNIPDRIARKLQEFTGTSMTLRSDGNDFVYLRRVPDSD